VVEEGNSIWKSLDYIDSAFVARLKHLEPRERREVTILEFNWHFASQSISQETRDLLGREVAGVILSKDYAGRSVSLIVDSKEKVYRLAQFIDLQNLQTFDSRVPGLASLQLGESPGPANPLKAQSFAMLSQSKTIRVFSVSPEFTKLLLKLKAASDSRESMWLSASEIRWLQQDGWIWPETSD
jgi:hypothetical protein